MLLLYEYVKYKLTERKKMEQTKNFLKSKSIWGLILIVLGMILPKLGITVEETQLEEILTSLLTVVGFVLSIIGRFTADKKLTIF